MFINERYLKVVSTRWNGAKRNGKRMPNVKAKWKAEEHIIRDSDMDAMLEMLENSKISKSPLVYRWSDKDGEERLERLFVNHDMVKCMFCLLYVFGRRLSGILQLKREDLWTKKGFLYVRFRVLKKARRKDKLRTKTRVKRVDIERQWKYVQHIVNYISTLDSRDRPLFPGRSRPHTRRVKRKDEQGRTIKTYEYKANIKGIMSRQKAYKIVKALNPDAYPHWFRHSLATQLAEEGIDPWQLMNWFDWDRFATAKRYISGTAAMTRDISNREIGG